MEIALRQVGAVVLLSFSRPVNLEGDTSIAFRDRVKKIIADGKTQLVVDLSAVKFIDSFGLGALVSALRVVRGANGDLKLAAVPEKVSQVLQLTRLANVFDCYDSMPDALAAFPRED
ncbi:MAG: STAS domain-containing protein [Planctomycetota bacterium]